MKIKEFIIALSDFDLEVEVKCTWEGQTWDIEPKNIYRAKNGIVLIDSDGNFYKERFMGGEEEA